MRRKIIVRKETHEINILTCPALSEKQFCADCRREVRWLIPEEAIVLAKTNLREIFQLIETGKIHFLESTEGFLLVCAESLAGRMQKK